MLNCGSRKCVKDVRSLRLLTNKNALTKSVSHSVSFSCNLDSSDLYKIQNAVREMTVRHECKSCLSKATFLPIIVVNAEVRNISSPYIT